MHDPSPTHLWSTFGPERHQHVAAMLADLLRRQLLAHRCFTKEELPINAALTIQPKHFALRAAVYIRQSTPKQLQENTESTRRQYQLADTAHELGWPRPLITVIDDDLGLSGTSSVLRVGSNVWSPPSVSARSA